MTLIRHSNIILLAIWFFCHLIYFYFLLLFMILFPPWSKSRCSIILPFSYTVQIHHCYNPYIYIACILLGNFQRCELSDDSFFQCHHHVLTWTGLTKPSATITSLDTNWFFSRSLLVSLTFLFPAHLISTGDKVQKLSGQCRKDSEIFEGWLQLAPRGLLMEAQYLLNPSLWMVYHTHHRTNGSNLTT